MVCTACPTSSADCSSTDHSLECNAAFDDGTCSTSSLLPPTPPPPSPPSCASGSYFNSMVCTACPTSSAGCSSTDHSLECNAAFNDGTCSTSTTSSSSPCSINEYFVGGTMSS